MKLKSLIDFHTKTGIQFHVPSAHAILKTVFTRYPIFPERFSIAIVIAIPISETGSVYEMMFF